MPGEPSKAFQKLLAETNQDHTVRQPLYEQIERLLAERLERQVAVLAFFTSFHWPVVIDNGDVDMIEEVLRNTEMDDRELVLIVSSPGGDGLAAERIVNICRAYSNDGRFSVVVPKMAKSAATMICFGASRVLMSDTSELGPVDPQVPIRDERGKVINYQAAHEVIQAYEDLLQKANSTKGRVEPYLQQLARFDARDIRQIASAQKLSASIAVKCLRSGCLAKFSEAAIKSKIKPFLEPDRTISHGRPIYPDVARKCGLDVDVVPIRCELWNAIWSLYVRMNHLVSSQPVGKVVESKTTEYTARLPEGLLAE